MTNKLYFRILSSHQIITDTTFHTMTNKLYFRILSSRLSLTSAGSETTKINTDIALRHAGAEKSRAPKLILERRTVQRLVHNLYYIGINFRLAGFKTTYSHTAEPVLTVTCEGRSPCIRRSVRKVPTEFSMHYIHIEHLYIKAGHLYIAATWLRPRGDRYIQVPLYWHRSGATLLG